MEIKQLMQICTAASPIRLGGYLPLLNAAMTEFGIDSRLRVCMFVGQCAHESGEFRWLQELWGPTPQQLRYSLPSDLAKELGNTQPEDGKAFRGHGVLQITGRFNHATAGKALGVDLVSHPELAGTPDYAFRVGAWFWATHKLDQYADTGDIIGCTRKINGALTGLESRKLYYGRALAAIPA